MRTTFEYLAHLVTTTVTVDGVDSTFVVDSGIGVTIVSAELARRAGIEPNGAPYTGKRMSGQEVTLELAPVGTVALGEHVQRDAEVGVLDLSGFPPVLQSIGGFLSLSFFEDAPFTVDYARRELRVGDAGDGRSVDVRVERDGPATTVFLPLTLPGGREALVEVDMGSDVLILDERYGDGLEPGDVVEGVDETGNPYTRRFTALPGRVHAAQDAAVGQDDPRVQIQRIIYDGLVGDDFLRRFTVTFDPARERMIFSG